ncbi:MAG TPA: hypothetical protein DDZ24_05930, partial [Planctomycetaceae bacterium]|nr:hypothetical protein [Planctomycetaceae bacterium]
MTSFYALSFVKRMIIGIFVSLLTLFPFGLNSTASEITDQQMLDVFPPTVAATEKSQRGNTLISLDYTPSTSLWAEGLDERQVFHAQIQHDQ